ncbi:hypothetical protein SAMN05660649_04329 [Desulfotomaculum arcticum]|uniref:Uncharacterized protein n=1 Tax=Desulfotruncus arcticus DSM 17038 TaxID=1121424 RepID=A0A1I2Y9G0_9FIRM|nr:hypothetical protein [Desulfotruncus arcticus]SFH22344.1 hypothetical protein SAMN05660649_04329 [Desulfotomaculum arcticum] [Desulfotruncus arcticus DSM 17038]
MYDGKFSKDSDYKTAFTEAVKELTAKEMPMPWRIKAVDDLCEAYVNQTGELPDTKPLEWLANCILKDDLADKCPDKVTRQEYPFLSDGQVKVRNKRETPRPDLSYYSYCKTFPKKDKRRRHNKCSSL